MKLPATPSGWDRHGGASRERNNILMMPLLPPCWQAGVPLGPL